MKGKPLLSAPTAQRRRNGAPAELREMAAVQQHLPMMADLYARAVAQLRAKRKSQKAQARLPKSAADPDRLLHELQVHQVELELQNEELKRSNAQAETNARKFSDLYDFAPIGYVSLDDEGRIQELNLTAATLFGKPRTAVAGKLMVSCVAPPYQDTFRRHLSAASAAQTKVTEEVELSSRNGHKVPVQLWTVGRRSEPGQAGQFLTAISDITALKSVEVELRRLNAELEDRVRDRTARVRQHAVKLTLAEQRDKSRLAYVLHEELPQLQMATALDLQSARAGCNGPGRKLLSRAQQTLSRCIEFAHDLSVELSPPILRLEGLGAATRWLGDWMRQKHGLFVRVSVPPRHAPLPDEVAVLLYQAVRELLLNSVKHAQATSASVTVEWMDSHVRVIVSDRGKGFDPATLQTDSASRKFGLFYVREHVGLLGGHLEIESAPDRGSRFTLRVPLHKTIRPRTRNKAKAVL